MPRKRSLRGHFDVSRILETSKFHTYVFRRVIAANDSGITFKFPDPQVSTDIHLFRADLEHFTEYGSSLQGFLDNCHIFWVHVSMGRWKRHGVIVVLFSTDHDPKHVHVFEDRKRLLKFNIETWTVMEGKMTPKAKKALEALRKEGIL